MPEPVVPKRVFRAWLEDWEYDSIYKRDVVDEAKLLQKYGGLHWMDIDKDELCIADGDSMEYQGGRNGAGWCVIVIRVSDGDREPWALDVVVDEIPEYQQPTSLNVEVVVNESLRAINVSKRLREEAAKSAKRKQSRR